MFEAMAKVDRKALGFTPVTRDASIRLEQGPRNGYDAMLHIEGKTSRTVAFRSVGSGYEWIGEQEIFEGPRRYKTVDGEFQADPGKIAAAEREENKQEQHRRKVSEKHSAFVAKIKSLPDAARIDPGVAAVLKFLNRDKHSMKDTRHWDEIISSNSVLSFRLQGDLELVCQRPAVRNAIQAGSSDDNAPGLCSILGSIDEIARLHPPIKGVRGAQRSGANIVSFNLDAFKSYGKTQGRNAPVGETAAFAYTTALNRLLTSDSKQRLQIGDTSTVFWSERSSILETAIPDIFDDPPKDDPDRNTRAIRALYESPRTGAFEAGADSDRFFVLGLAPSSKNAARIAVRFWHVSTVAGLATEIRRHFDDMQIVRSKFERPYFSLFRVLVSTALRGKIENVQPKLTGDLMRSILTGVPYPLSLLQTLIARVRAEQAKKNSRGRPVHNVTYVRAALIKACLNRAARFSKSGEEELTVSLDQNNLNAGYRLGRLFAVLEKIQEESSPGINATIRDRFYGAAASTPVAVFSNLMKLKNHHLAKMDNRGRVVNFERLVGEIMSGIRDFPAHLSLGDQGRFAIGYYHQRQAFFTKQDTAT